MVSVQAWRDWPTMTHHINLILYAILHVAYHIATWAALDRVVSFFGRAGPMRVAVAVLGREHDPFRTFVPRQSTITGAGPYIHINNVLQCNSLHVLINWCDLFVACIGAHHCCVIERVRCSFAVQSRKSKLKYKLGNGALYLCNQKIRRCRETGIVMFCGSAWFEFGL